MRKIDHSPSFDGIAEIVAKDRRTKIAIITLFGTTLVFSLLAGVIFGVMNNSNLIVSLHLFLFPLVLSIALAAFVQVSHLSRANLQKLYTERAKVLLSEIFDLQLDESQVQQLGLGEDWRAIRPGVAIGSTATLSDFPKPESRYHSLIAVKVDETSVGIFETERETVITRVP